MNNLLSKYILGVICLILLIPSSPLFAQRQQTVQQDLSLPPSVVTVHSPHKATIYSALLPGLGQIYNKKYWKVPILYAGIGVTIYAIDWNTKRYKENKNGYRDFTQFMEWKYRDKDKYPDMAPPEGNSYLKILNWDFEGTNSRTDNWFQTQLKNRKDSFKHDRDLGYIILAGIYVLNIIDATVDAHFFNFNVNENLSVKVEPAINCTANAGNAMGFKCSIKF